MLNGAFSETLSARVNMAIRNRDGYITEIGDGQDLTAWASKISTVRFNGTRTIACL